MCNKIFFVVMVLLLGMGGALAASSASEKHFATLVQQKDDAAVLHEIEHSVGKTISIEDAEAIAKKAHYEPLVRAIRGCRSMDALERVYAKENALCALAFFIETELKKSVLGAQASVFVRPHIPGVHAALQFDPTTKAIYIHFTSPKSIIGAGFKKIVSCSIQYDCDHPKAVAHTEQVDVENGLKEYVNLQQTAQIPHITHVRAVAEDTYNGQTKLSMVFDLYNRGSLRQIKRRSLTMKQKYSIARQVLQALAQLHTLGFAHRDIHQGNILLNMEGSKLEAALADLGGMELVASAKKNHSLPALIPTYNPPEAFGSLENVDYTKSDMFALGITLYETFYRDRMAWRSEQYLPVATLLTNQYQPVLRDKLAAKIKETLSHVPSHALHDRRSAALYYTIARMLDPNPALRPTAAQALHALTVGVR